MRPVSEWIWILRQFRKFLFSFTRYNYTYRGGETEERFGTGIGINFFGELHTLPKYEGITFWSNRWHIGRHLDAKKGV